MMNLILLVALDKLNLPLSHLQAPTLVSRSFNNQLLNILGSIVLPIEVGYKTNHYALQVM